MWLPHIPESIARSADLSEHALKQRDSKVLSWLRRRDKIVGQPQLETLLTIYSEEQSVISEALRRTEEILAILQVRVAGESLRDPSKRLPSELLSRIFEFSAPREVLDTFRGALFISHVSRCWRNVALSTPALWNTFSVDTQIPDKLYLKLVRTFMERSTALPLNISIPCILNPPKQIWSGEDRVDHDVSTATRCMRVTLGSIVPYARRWKIIELDNVVAEAFVSALAGYPDVSFPLLEELKLNSQEEAQYTTSLPQLFQHAPKLHTLRMWGCDFDLSGIGEQLANLIGVFRSNYLERLAQCPNIKHLYILFGGPVVGVRPQPTSLSALVNLTITFELVNWDHITHIFTNLDLPALEDLVLALTFFPTEEPPSIQLIRAKTLFPNLCRVTARCGGFSSTLGEQSWHYDALWQLLLKFPTVTDFGIVWGMPRGFIHQMQAELFPQLETLRISNCKGGELCGPALATMLQSRGCRAVNPNKGIVSTLIMHNCQQSPSALPQLRILVDKLYWYNL